MLTELFLTTSLATSSMSCGVEGFMRIVQNESGEVISRECVQKFWDCPDGTVLGGFQISADRNDDFYRCAPQNVIDGKVEDGVG